ncbi:zf-RVT domain-containing protein [Cephalotus follicularis]|uniref:Zf-RVT domain-containing protein n=1 Tax=Cephalotus follicularis TaxID=3775 RepID=A0A1Q3CWU0_CEPFO|nr:zf-RVT domain-containing protein [Cephalotus follicularis]
MKKGCNFSLHEAWRAFILHSPIVPWSNVVWFPRQIPKHSFCLWLTFRDGHKTLNKLHRWGVVQSVCCAFGCGQKESIDHLFFACPFTTTIWNHFLAKCGFRRCSGGWSVESAWCIQRLQGNSFKSWITKLTLTAVMYQCWMERNNHFFQNSFRNCDSLIESVALDIEGKCRGLIRVADNPTNSELFFNWNLPTSLLSVGASMPAGYSWSLQ